MPLSLLPPFAVLAQPPTPESVLGHKPGDDFDAASYDESLACFRKLAQSTNKPKLVHVGKTTRGLLPSRSHSRFYGQRYAEPESGRAEAVTKLGRGFRPSAGRNPSPVFLCCVEQLNRSL